MLKVFFLNINSKSVDVIKSALMSIEVFTLSELYSYYNVRELHENQYELFIVVAIYVIYM